MTAGGRSGSDRPRSGRRLPDLPQARAELDGQAGPPLPGDQDDEPVYVPATREATTDPHALTEPAG